jgi:hypothetical protein
MSIETWKPIVGYEQLYSISNIGNVKGLTRGGILKPAFRSGYQAVGLYNNKDKKTTTIPIHRLVALNFLENPKLEILLSILNNENNLLVSYRRQYK